MFYTYMYIHIRLINIINCFIPYYALFILTGTSDKHSSFRSCATNCQNCLFFFVLSASISRAS